MTKTIELFDPLFGGKKKVEFDSKVEASSADYNRGNFVKAFVGGVNDTPIPVMVDSANRICLPVKK